MKPIRTEPQQIESHSCLTCVFGVRNNDVNLMKHCQFRWQQLIHCNEIEIPQSFMSKTPFTFTKFPKHRINERNQFNKTIILVFCSTDDDGNGCGCGCGVVVYLLLYTWRHCLSKPPHFVLSSHLSTRVNN